MIPAPTRPLLPQPPRARTSPSSSPTVGKRRYGFARPLTLPHHQDAVVAAVAAANPHTIVVLETGNPVTMPWVNAPAAILEAWFAGSDGANAVGNVFFGVGEPQRQTAQHLPQERGRSAPPHACEAATGVGALLRPGESPSKWAKGLPPFQVTYDEGVKVGYKWYDAEKKPVLFPFGFGLSYTTYKYSALTSRTRRQCEGDIHRSPTPARASGSEIAEVYAMLPDAAGEPFKRLVGFTKVKLDAKAKQTVTVDIDPKYLSIFDEAKDGWTLVPGDYTILVGGSSQDLPLKATVKSEVARTANTGFPELDWCASSGKFGRLDRLLEHHEIADRREAGVPNRLSSYGKGFVSPVSA